MNDVKVDAYFFDISSTTVSLTHSSSTKSKNGNEKNNNGLFIARINILTTKITENLTNSI
jgi:hypothetical protein